MEKGGAITTLNVSDIFALRGVSGPLVEFVFDGGPMFMELFPDVAPLTVANFLRYTDNKIYNNTFIHRFINGFVMQAGGYQWLNGTPAVPTYPPVLNEFNLSNLTGTVAMAKIAGDLNSATSEWYVNLVDNTFLDAPGQKFTVFGKLTGRGVDFCRSIASLPIVNLGGPFENLPVKGYSSGPVLLSNLLVLQTVQRIPLVKLPSGAPGYLVLTVATSNNAVITPVITAGGLKLTSGSILGEATITLTARDYYNQSVSTTFLARNIQPGIPKLRLPTLIGGNMNFFVASLPGYTYQVQETFDLTSLAWVSVGAPVSGTGEALQFSVPTMGNKQFFRVQMTNLP